MLKHQSQILNLLCGDGVNLIHAIGLEHSENAVEKMSNAFNNTVWKSLGPYGGETPRVFNFVKLCFYKADPFFVKH